MASVLSSQQDCRSRGTIRQRSCSFFSQSVQLPAGVSAHGRTGEHLNTPAEMRKWFQPVGADFWRLDASVAIIPNFSPQLMCTVERAGATVMENGGMKELQAGFLTVDGLEYGSNNLQRNLSVCKEC